MIILNLQCKHMKIVEIYVVVSHGRRFQRSLVFTTDTRFCLSELQPSLRGRASPWLPFERFLGGDPRRVIDPKRNGGGCVLLRAREHPDNLRFILKYIIHPLLLLAKVFISVVLLKLLYHQIF
jgi:hypothetical protein